MKKPFKTLSSATLAAVFAASAIVPVASAEAATNKQIDEVVFSKDKELISLTAVEYNDAFEAGLLANDTISHIKVGDKYFTAEQFNDAFEAQSNLEEAIKLLEEKATPAELKDVTQGTIKDGQLVGKDETPEEKVNETFFYNLAA